MGAWVALYTQIRGELVKARGRGATGRTGADLPPTFAHEPFIFLALLWPSFMEAVKTAGGGFKHAYPAGPPSSNAQKILRRIDSPDATGAVELEKWLSSAKPAGDDPSVRYVTSSLTSMVSIPVAYGHTNRALEWSGRDPDVAMVRSVLVKWNVAIKMAGLCLEKMGTHPTLTPDQTVDWWSAMYQLLVAMEVVIENPPPTLGAQVIGGIKKAAEESVKATQEILAVGSDLAGRAAAEVAKSAGIAAGAAAKGFFDQAGMTAYLVVAVCIAVALA